MFSRENMQAALSKSIDFKTRESKRLKEAGVVIRPIDPTYSSQRNQAGPSDQVPTQCERYY